MADGVHIQVDAKELDRDLDRLGHELEHPDLDRIADDLARAVAAASPRSSGALAASWSGRAVRDSAVATSSVPYAGVIRGGWAERNIEPNDYVSRADRVMGPRAEQLLSEEIDHQIKMKGLH